MQLQHILPLPILRRLLRHEVEEHSTFACNLFCLSFMLIGINLTDLLSLTPSSIIDNRVEYIRSKTKRPYSIRVEPEAAELISRMNLFALSDSEKKHRNIYRMIFALRLRGETSSPVPGFSLYWARHSWASVASLLDIPKDTIAACLGHGARSVTDVYIDFNLRKIDAANRKVLDFLLYSDSDGFD